MQRRGRMVSLATQTDRTLFFDFLPIDLGHISGFSTRFQLYTVPGQVYYNATRRLVLQGADGVVFVADSQARQLDENIESLQNLQSNLLEMGVDIRTLPVVMQYNKQDLPARADSPDRGPGRRAQFPRHPELRRRRAARPRRVRDAQGDLRAGAQAALGAGARCDRSAQRQVFVRDIRRRRGQPPGGHRRPHGCREPRVRLQPAVHLQRVGARQDAPADGGRPGGAQALAQPEYRVPDPGRVRRSRSTPPWPRGRAMRSGAGSRTSTC